MKRRFITPHVLAALKDTPVVFIAGPRQSGKTTLVQGIRAAGHEAAYRTFDDAAELAPARSDPDGYIDGLPERVILDEVQRVPDLFRAIKRSVDRDRRPGRFLITGSANVLALPRVSESLAGRMEILTLWPFSQGEIAGREEGFIDASFARGAERLLAACGSGRSAPGPAGAKQVPGRRHEASWPALVERIVRGGFPEVQSRAAAARREAWFGAYVTMVLERDVRDIAQVQALRDLPRLLRLAAARTMGLLNIADLARDAALPQTTLQRYWSMFAATFLVRELPPWSSNLGARLVKTPKVLVADSGLLCALAGLDAARLKADALMTGAVLECFVANELTRQAAWSVARPRLFHFRTHAQQEVDFVLEDAAGRLVGIEVKKSASPTPADFKGLRQLRELTGKRFVRGILLHTGATGAAFEEDLLALPVSALWRTEAAAPARRRRAKPEARRVKPEAKAPARRRPQAEP